MTRGVKNKAGGQWNTSRYFSFIRSTLRRAYTRYPVKYAALEAARRPFKGTDKSTKWEFNCSQCDEWFKGKDVEVDHIIPCGSLTKYDDLPGFTERLFCEVESLRVVCKPCHKVITAEERERKKNG
jgi:hypothetical protein